MKKNAHSPISVTKWAMIGKSLCCLGAASILLPTQTWAVLPDNLTLNVGDIDNDGSDETLVLTKRSMRSSWNHKLLTWDSVNGYQEITPPEVRTYRGYVQDDPDMRVNANIEPGNVTMNANLSDGHELNYRLTSFPVSITGADGTSDPGTGNIVVPFVEDRTAPTANGYIVPTHHMRRLDYAVTISNDYYVGMGSNVEAAVSRVEQRMNDTDFFYARDIGMAHEIGWMVVNLEENPASWTSEWTNVHQPNGAVYEMRGKFKKPGGAGASGDCFLGGRHTAGTLAAYSKSHGHELGHTLGAGHYSSWGDVMSGSESAIGSGTVERMIGNAAIATEAQSPALTYGSPLPPFAMEDCVTMVMDTTLDIDVLENDYDGNGDAISLSYVDAVTEKGGTTEIINGKVRYTPPPHWQGQDTFVYHVKDATGIANRTGYVKVAVHNNGLATHIRLDETSGTVAHDVGPFQAHGVMDQGFSFDTNSVAGKVGTALERTAADHTKASADFWGTGDPLNGDLSVSLWVKYQSGVPTVASPVICKGASVIRGRFGNPRGGWAIGHTADGKFRFEGNLNRDSQYTYTNPQFDLEGGPAISNDTWHHLVMVMDRNTKQLRAWVDNQEVTNTTFGTAIADGVIDNSHHPLVIYDSVSQQSQSTDTPVTVDDVRIYHKALSASEVADLYQNPDADVAAGAPSPAHGSSGALVGQDLSWIPGKTSGYLYDVYFGTDYQSVLNATTASSEYQGQQSGTSFTPTTSGGARYFWRIDQISGSTTVTGDVWWFDTDASSPLNDPVFANGSFENPALASAATSNDINDWFDASSYTWTQDDASTIHPDTPYGENWAELGNGRWIYQQIGSYQEGMDLDISFLAGQPDGNSFGGITVELLVGGDPGLASDQGAKRSDANFALEATVGATVIASSGQLNPFSSSGQATQEMSVSLSTGTGYAVGEPLWLLLYRPSSGGRALIDNVQVVHTNAGPTNSDPVFNANPISEEYVTVGKDYNSSLADNASDPDGDSLTFTKLSGPAWLIVASDGELTGVPFVGDDGLNTFTVQVEDGNGGAATTQVEIEVLADTKAPAAPASLLATAGDGTVTLDWSANTESDFSSYRVYRSTTSGSGYAALAIDHLSSSYVDNSVVNGTTYYYAISAVDTSGNESGYSSESSATPQFPNTAPVLDDVTFGVVESAPIGTSVGTIVGSDPDAGDVLTYSITDGNVGSVFAINSATGDITLAAGVDYETVSQYQLGVKVTDPIGAEDSATVTIHVTDVDDNSFTLVGGDIGDAANWTDGSIPSATVAGTVAVDATTPSVIHDMDFVLTAGTVSRNQNSVYEWTGDTDVVIDGGTLDYTASSAAGGTHRVLRIKDTSSLTMVSGHFILWDDRALEMFGQGTIHMQGGSIQAGSLQDRSGLTPGAVLTFDQGDGVVTLSGDGITMAYGGYIDFLSGSQGQLTVSGADAAYYESLWNAGSLKLDGSNAVPFVVYFEVNGESLSLRDTPLSAPVLNDAVLSLDENVSAGTVVGTLSPTSSYGALTWQLIDDGGGVFSMDASSGEISNTQVVDFETSTSFTLTAQLTDGTTMSDTAVITVNVNDLNEAPTAADTSGSVVENSVAGVVVTSVVASDVDAGDSLSYAITAGNESGHFAIDSLGAVTTTGPLDFETVSQYTLTVTVTDSGSLSDIVTVTVSVIDANEAPSAVGQTVVVAENAGAGVAAGVINASDPDAGDSLGYMISSGNGGGLFAIDASGNITTTGSLDLESESQHVLTITVTDSGLLTASAIVIVDVSNVNEDPVLADATVSLAEDAVIGTNVVTLAGTDPDAGDSLSYAITSGSGFAINSATGEITTTAALDYETSTQHQLIVTVTDAGGLSDTATVTVDVTDVMEVTAPVVGIGSASNLTQTSADIAYSISDDGGEDSTVTLYYGVTDGGAVPVSWDSSLAQGMLATGSYGATLTGLTENMTYFFSVHVSNSAGDAWSSSGSFTTEADTSPKLVRTTVTGVSNTGWTTVNLGKNYTSAVIIATPMYPDSSVPPVVTRMSNVSGSSFDLKIDRADGSSAATSVDVSVIAVEEGVYTQATDGVTMEAVKFTSTVTARKSNWNAEARTYQNSYTNPVVVGQVMSANDANWSAFWSMGSSRTAPANATNLNVGKHVAEDSNTTRADETIGYMVIESGNGVINGIGYEAGLGSDIVEGVGETSTGWSYSLSGTLTSASAAALSQSAMDGNDGGWAVLYGSNPFTTTSVTTAIDEDQIGGSERNHGTEQVGYLVFE